MEVRKRTIAIAFACAFAGALLISLLIRESGQTAAPDSPALQKAAVQRDSAPTNVTSNDADAISVQAAATLGDEHRVIQLQRELSAARAEKALLLQRREALNARIASHQEDGMQLLASLKAQRASGSNANFEANAKSTLEAMLVEDTDMTSELTTVDEQLHEKESRIQSLTTEIESVHTISKR